MKRDLNSNLPQEGRFAFLFVGVVCVLLGIGSMMKGGILVQDARNLVVFTPFLILLGALLIGIGALSGHGRPPRKGPSNRWPHLPA
jgi:hypothetical protein